MAMTPAVKEIGIKGQYLANVSAHTNVTFNLSDFVGIVFTVHNSLDSLASAFIIASSGLAKVLDTNSAIQMSTANNVLTVSHVGAAGTVAIYAIILNGSITLAT